MFTGERTAASTLVGHYRWTICALLFFSTTINYMDRQVLGLLKPTLMGDSSLYLVGLVIRHLILPKTESGKTPAGIEV